jgi:hypothetical protein
MSDEAHLILHLVRGEPEFGVAVPMERNGEVWWIICSSGHRAYPFKKWPLEDLVDTSDINYAGRHPRPLDFLDTVPEYWPDHYQTIKHATKADLETKIDPKLEAAILKELGL